jgi:hypothetical protein
LASLLLSAGDRSHDGNGLAILHWRVQALLELDVDGVAISIELDVSIEMSRQLTLIEQARLKSGVLLSQVLEHKPDGGAFYRHLLGAVGSGAQGCGDSHYH